MAEINKKDNLYIEEIEPGIYVVRGTGHTKGVLNYSELVEKIKKGFDE